MDSSRPVVPGTLKGHKGIQDQVYKRMLLRYYGGAVVSYDFYDRWLCQGCAGNPRRDNIELLFAGHTMSSDGDVTRLLADWQAGDRGALDRLVVLVRADLRRRAQGFMHKERLNHTLQPTALVNETYLRLVDQHRIKWKNRGHFFAVASRLMRRILVDHARKQHATKRGAGMLMVTLDDTPDLATDERSIDLVALDQALGALRKLSRRQARIVELRYFGGLTIEETAEVLSLSTATVKLDWRMAKAWLFGRLRAS